MSSMMADSTQPWCDGVWKEKSNGMHVQVVKGEDIQVKPLSTLDYPNAKPFMEGKLRSGDFGPTPEEIATTSGIMRYNIQYEWPALMSKTPAALSCGGKRIHFYGLADGGRMNIYDILDEKQLEALKAEREPLDSPSLPSYITPKPGHTGRILWFSGVPGVGKSTTAQLLARNHGYVYYELDCFCNGVNPFIDINAEDLSIQNVKQIERKQKPLKIISEEMLKMKEDWAEIIQMILQGRLDGLEEKFDSCIATAGNHIMQQRQRLGGDWAVAFVVFTQKQREKIRQLLGPDLIHIVLRMTDGCMRKRLLDRHKITGFVDKLIEMNKMYEDVGDDEENAYRITVDESMSRDDVVEKTLEIIAKL